MQQFRPGEFHLHSLTHAARLKNFARASSSLAVLSDIQLEGLIAESTLRPGIGGASGLVEIDGVTVFVKRIALTATEQQEKNRYSTANIFNLPAHFHYGVLSLGFGAWRELACHELTTNWVLEQEFECFPMLYHSRVIDRMPQAEPDESLAQELKELLSYWKNLPEVMRRSEGLAQSNAAIYLFLEAIPHNLTSWLNSQTTSEDSIASACAMVERNLRTEVSRFSQHEFVHFDAHAGNILTDGERLYFADFGLALSNRFQLDEDERSFFEQHKLYDSAQSLAQLVNWLATTYGGAGKRSVSERNKLLQEVSAGQQVSFASPAAFAVVQRYATLVTLFNDFYGRLFRGDIETRFPSDEIDEALRTCG